MQRYARQAITTKYHGPTNTKGSRISATTAAGARLYVGYDDALSALQNHIAACKALVAHMDWTSEEWVCGVTKDGYVFVDVQRVKGRNEQGR